MDAEKLVFPASAISPLVLVRNAVMTAAGMTADPASTERSVRISNVPALHITTKNVSPEMGTSIGSIHAVRWKTWPKPVIGVARKDKRNAIHAQPPAKGKSVEMMDAEEAVASAA